MQSRVIFKVSLVVFVMKLVDDAQGTVLSCTGMQEAHLWTKHGNSCYLIRTEVAYPFDEGRAYCQDRCSDHVTPNTAAENSWVWETLKSSYPPGNPDKMWLGCNKPENDWVCTGDEAGNEYRNWHGQEPSESVRLCVRLIRKTGKWLRSGECDNNTKNPKWIMCEAPAEPPISPLRVRCNAVAPPIGKCPVPIHTVRVTSPMQCCLACAKQCNCRSFSLIPGSLDRRMNLGKINDPTTTLTDQTCEYYGYEIRR